ncbi:MAG: TonB-dependent receptor [Bryobacteraceae bacterium]
MLARMHVRFPYLVARHVLLAVIATMAPALVAQQASSVRVGVNDPSGAAVVANGRLRGPGYDRSFQTDARGETLLSNVPAGRYRLTISKSGFATVNDLLAVSDGSPVEHTVTLALSTAAFAVDVADTTPLAGVDLAANEVAAPIQTLSASDIESSGALDLSSLLNRRLNGVYINELQGNPVQPDVNYRGYTASPLLGTPQGVSVYLDGVRMNQPFGDVVSWDLIPRIAIAEITLIPGSNPLFGLNTLGGAISVRTKDGYSARGTSLQIGGGSFGRKTADFEHGGSNAKGLSWYLAGNLFFEDGWRETSPSNVRQTFGKLSWQHAKTTMTLAGSFANNSLNGNGTQEFRLLEQNYSSVYTRPDITRNRSPFLNLSAQHAATQAWTLTGNAYYRYIRTSSLNGDINEGSLDQSVYQPGAAERAALAAAGYTGFPASGATATNTPFPFWRCIGNVLLNDEPGEKCNGLINRTFSQQRNFGAAGQATWRTSGFHSDPASRNQLTFGGAFDRSNTDFSQSSELGYLLPDRSIRGMGAFADGLTGGVVDGVPFDTRVNLHGRVTTGSAYATDTLSLGDEFSFTFSGRYNRTNIDNRDRLVHLDGSRSISGNNAYGRFNPAVGVTYHPRKSWNAYASYSEGSRAPASIELGCADPAEPCKLPNSMTSDPPLKQVVTRTIEAGLRGSAETRLHWSVGWFRSANRNDILFVASPQTGFGYFKNFGETRRQGVQIDANTRIHKVTVGVGYTFLDATFRSPESVMGTSNSANVDALAGVKGIDSTIAVQPGNQIPLIPQHTMKAYADFQVNRKLSVQANVIAAASSFARGNENNQHKPDGTYYLGSGTSPAYGVVNLGAHYQLHSRVQLILQVNNLFNKHYYTGAQLGPTGFTNTSTFIARPLPATPAGDFPVQQSTFYAPGAPIGAWGGLRFSF